MRSFANEMSQLVHQALELDNIAVKIASVEGSVETQLLKSQVSDGIYTVIEKTAEEKSLTIPELVEKIAGELKREVPADCKMALAAAAAVDAALTNVIAASQNSSEAVKLAESRSYGREYFLELLGKVI
jgi:hypothetical protein